MLFDAIASDARDPVHVDDRTENLRRFPGQGRRAVRAATFGSASSVSVTTLVYLVSDWKRSHHRPGNIFTSCPTSALIHGSRRGSWRLAVEQVDDRATSSGGIDAPCATAPASPPTVPPRPASAGSPPRRAQTPDRKLVRRCRTRCANDHHLGSHLQPGPYRHANVEKANVRLRLQTSPAHQRRYRPRRPARSRCMQRAARACGPASVVHRRRSGSESDPWMLQCESDSVDEGGAGVSPAVSGNESVARQPRWRILCERRRAASP